MPYLRLDLAKTYPPETKRELAKRLWELYADVMQTQLWRPNVGIAELGEENLFQMGEDGLESITMVLVEIRRARSLDLRLELGRRIVDICTEVLGVPKGLSINNRVIIATDREDLLSGIHNDESRDVAWRDDSSRSGARRAEALSRDGPCSE